MGETRHSVDPKFTYRDKRTGTDVVLYKGLLDAAHRAGLVSIKTEVLQYPHAENDHTCIVSATAFFLRPDAPLQSLNFQAIGDANPKNVGPMVAPHFVRMAETRAKARALRDALNVGMVTVEELGGDHDEDAPPVERPAPRPAPHMAPTRAVAPQERREAPQAAADTPAPAADGWTAVWTEARRRGIHDREALARFMGVASAAALEPAAILARLREAPAGGPLFAGHAG